MGFGLFYIYTWAWGIEKESILDLYLIFFMYRGKNCSYWVVTHSSFPVGDGLRTPQLPGQSEPPKSLHPTALDWKILIWPWKSGITNHSKNSAACGRVPWLTCTPQPQSPPCALVEKPFPPVRTDLTLPWVINRRLLSQLVFLEKRLNFL